jgi:hypothetical protein
LVVLYQPDRVIRNRNPFRCPNRCHSMMFLTWATDSIPLLQPGHRNPRHPTSWLLVSKSWWTRLWTPSCYSNHGASQSSFILIVFNRVLRSIIARSRKGAHRIIRGMMAHSKKQAHRYFEAIDMSIGCSDKASYSQNMPLTFVVPSKRKRLLQRSSSLLSARRPSFHERRRMSRKHALDSVTSGDN